VCACGESFNVSKSDTERVPDFQFCGLKSQIMSVDFKCLFCFQGVMKRHGFSGGPASHGASLAHRTLGSVGHLTSHGKVSTLLDWYVC